MLLVSVLLSAAVGASAGSSAAAPLQPPPKDAFATVAPARERASRSPSLGRPSKRLSMPRPKSARTVDVCRGSAPCSALEREYLTEEDRQHLLRFKMLLW
jgi:hypothetical protein